MLIFFGFHFVLPSSLLGQSYRYYCNMVCSCSLFDVEMLELVIGLFIICFLAVFKVLYYIIAGLDRKPLLYRLHPLYLTLYVGSAMGEK